MIFQCMKEETVVGCPCFTNFCAKNAVTGAGYDGFEPTLDRQQGLVFTLLFLLFRSLSMSLALPGTDATARRRSRCAHFSVSEVIQRCVS